MAGRLTLSALWCDQGMAHLLEMYATADATAPSKIVLIDFGAETMKKTSVLVKNQSAPAVNTVVSSLILQQEAGETPMLDYVLISHQDTDHWSLLTYLMDAVDELKIPMKVGTIIFAGSDWGARADATVARLEKYGVNGPATGIPLEKDLSHYRDANGTLGSLVTIGSVVLRILIANAPITSKKKAHRVNGTSAVVVIDYGERMILPGDATWETLKSASDALEKWTESPVRPVKVMSAPHHGALDTMTPTNKGAASDLAQLKRFVGFVQPQAVVSSAGFDNSFKHPYQIILDALAEYANTDDNNPGLGDHYIVIYGLDPAGFKIQEETKKNLYTTVLNLVSPVICANYLFTRNEFAFITEKFELLGPSKAMVSVPYTSGQVIEIEREDSNRPFKKQKIDKQSDFVARPIPGSIHSPPAWIPPARRVSPAVAPSL